MSAPHTNRELPKNGASTRLAAISSPSRTAPEVKTASPSARTRWRCTAGRAGTDGSLGAGARGAGAGSLIASTLQAVHRHPRARAADAALDAVDRSRVAPQRVVEPRLARVQAAGREDAVGDRPVRHDVADAAAAQAREVAVRIGCPPRTGELEAERAATLRRRERRVERDEPVPRQLARDPFERE